MREADSAKNFVLVGSLQRSVSIAVLLLARMLAQGSALAGKRPPSGTRGVSVP
jgi:hypothetical protein